MEAQLSSSSQGEKEVFEEVIYTPVKMLSCKCQTASGTSGDVDADEDEC